MTAVYNGAGFALPAGNFSFFAAGVSGPSVPILQSPSTDGSWPLLQGIDLVDPDLLENNHATISISDPVFNAGGFFHQAFVYATSQGVFPWRGSLLIRPDMTVVLEPLVGAWSYVIWGLSIPPQSDVP